MMPKAATHHRRWVLRLFEWAVLVCLIALLSGLFLRRIERMQATIEQRNYQATVKALEAAVFLTATVRPQALEIGANPAMVHHEQFGILPEGYVGELERPAPEAIAGGSWYFDRGDKLLIYRVANNRFFYSPLSGAPRVRLQLDRSKSSGRLTLRALEDVCWLTDSKCATH